MLFSIFCAICLVVGSPSAWFVGPAATLVPQVCVGYYLYRLAGVRNLYQVVGALALVFGSISVYLFTLQLDVFACFLLVSESIVVLFALGVLLHLGVSNAPTPIRTTALLSCTVVFISPSCAPMANFGYWVDWYATATSHYNDLLPQFLYFYTYDVMVVGYVGLLLFVITVCLVQMILYSSTSDRDGASGYTHRSQAVWGQWYKKSVVRFFQK